MARERLSNFEALRLFGMVLIVAHHYASVPSWDFQRDSPQYIWFNEYLVHLFSTCGKISVDIFLLMTGWFLNGRPMKPQSIVRTWLQAIEWSYILFFAARYIFHIEIEGFQIKQALFPITKHLYWYVSSYVAACCCTGWIAAVAKHTTPMQAISGIVAYFILMCMIDWPLEISYCNTQWFIFVIGLGALMRRYSSIFDRVRTQTLWVFLGVLVSINMTIVYAFAFKALDWPSAQKGPNSLMRENWSLLALLYGCTLLLIGSRYQIQSNAINLAAECAFGVYLIHENQFVQPRIWSQWTKGFLFKDSELFPVIAVVQIVFVYAVCSFFEFLRQRLLNRPEEIVVASISRYAGNLADKVNSCFGSDRSDLV